MFAIYAYVPAYSLAVYFFQMHELIVNHSEASAFLAVFCRCGMSLIVIVSSLRVINSWYKRVPLLLLHQAAVTSGVIYIYAHRENAGFLESLKAA